MIKNVLLEINSKEFKQYSFEYKKTKWLIDVIEYNNLTEYWLTKWNYGFKMLIIGWSKKNKDSLTLDEILRNVPQDIELYKEYIEKLERF